MTKAVYIRSNLNNQRTRLFSLTATVTAMVCERGQATADDLLPELREFTRRQVLDALQNASYRGQLECTRGKSMGRGRLPGTYRPASAPKKRPEKPSALRVNSVFALGEAMGLSRAA